MIFTLLAIAFLFYLLAITCIFTLLSITCMILTIGNCMYIFFIGNYMYDSNRILNIYQCIKIYTVCVSSAELNLLFDHHFIIFI